MAVNGIDSAVEMKTLKHKHIDGTEVVEEIEDPSDEDHDSELEADELEEASAAESEAGNGDDTEVSADQHSVSI